MNIAWSVAAVFINCIIGTALASPASTTRAAGHSFPGRWCIWERFGADTRCGFIDSQGKVVIKPTFADARSFNDGLAWVHDKGTWAVINTDGERAFDVPAGISEVGNFSEGFADVNVGGTADFAFINGGSWFYLNDKGQPALGQKITSTIDSPLGTFSEGRASFRTGDKWGVLDNKGTVVVEPRYQDIHFFHEGMAAVKENKRWGYINRDGQLVIPAAYDSVSRFSEGVASVSRDGEYYFINLQGQKVPELAGVDAAGSSFSEGVAAVPLLLTGRLSPDARCVGCNASLRGLFYGNRCPKCGSDIEPPSMIGYIDHAGKRVIEPQFQEGMEFKEGLAAVRAAKQDGNPWGFVDKKGKWVIRPSFSDISGNGFYGDLARVSIPPPKSAPPDTSAREAYIDREGRIVWSTKE
jgi:hypothetical protein